MFVKDSAIEVGLSGTAYLCGFMWLQLKAVAQLDSDHGFGALVLPVGEVPCSACGLSRWVTWATSQWPWSSQTSSTVATPTPTR